MANNPQDVEQIRPDQEHAEVTDPQTAQAAAQQGEDEAAAAGIVAAALEEDSSAENLIAQAQKYAESIPTSERSINTPKDLSIIVAFMEAAYETSDRVTDRLSTWDSCGNFPNPVMYALVKTPIDRTFIARQLNDFAAISKSTIGETSFTPLSDDEMAIYSEADKKGDVMNTSFSPAMKEAMLKIILFDGPHSVVDVYQEIATRITSSEDSVFDIIHAYKDENKSAILQADQQRRAALRAFFEATCPELTASEEMQFVFRLSNMTGDEIENLSVADITGEFESRFGTIDIAQFDEGMKKRYTRTMAQNDVKSMILLVQRLVKTKLVSRLFDE